MGLSVYVLVAILKKKLGLDLSLHQIPQILSVTVFEKTLNSRGVFQLQRRDHRYRALHPVESIRLLMGQHWYGIYQIKDEGFNHSQVMDIMGYLSDVYGPRLTNSPDIKEA